MDDPSAIAQSAVQRMDAPVLAALPFTGAAEADWLGSALAGDILDEAIRRGGGHGLSRHTTFLPGKDVQALFALGATAVLSGRFEAGRLDLRIDRAANSRAHLALPVPSMAALRDTADRVAAWVVDMTGGPLDLPHSLRPGLRTEVPADAHAATLQILEDLWRFTPQSGARALERARAACETAQATAECHALRAFLVARAYRGGQIADRNEAVAEVSLALDAARQVWTDAPLLLWTRAFAEAMLFRRYPLAAALIRRAILLQPHASPVLTWGSLFLSYDLDFDAAYALALRAMRSSPEDPMRVTQGFAAALAAIHAARDREAVEQCDMVLVLNPAMPNVLRIRAAALHHLGDHVGARASIERLLVVDPNESLSLTARVNPLREWPGFQRFLDGLKGAGLP